jgi:hypothetical protein
MFLVVNVNRHPGQFPVRRFERQCRRDRRRVRFGRRHRLGCRSVRHARLHDLKISLGGGAGAGMSQNHVGLQFTNVGSASCALYGYPGVSWVAGADGHQVGAAATRQADPTGSAEKTVTLAPGALASAPIDLVDAAAIPPAQCKPVPVRGLRVYPPGEKAALFLSLPTTSGGYGECSLTTTNPTLFIGYVQAGVQPGGGDAG